MWNMFIRFFNNGRISSSQWNRTYHSNESPHGWIKRYRMFYTKSIQPQLKELWNNIPAPIKKMILSKTVITAIGAITVFFGVDAMVAGYIERNRIPRVVKQFEIGSKNLTIKKIIFPRDQEVAEIQELISPSASGRYYLITGEHGTGKTTLVRYACKNSQYPALYFDIPFNTKELAIALGKKVDFDNQVHISFWKQLRRRLFSEEKEFKDRSDLSLVLDSISLAGNVYAEKHKQPAVIFIDNLTILAKKDPETFELLVRFAKQEADNNTLIVTFVASEGHTLHQLKELSESSRLSNPIEIGDLNIQQTVNFLKLCGMEKETMATSIYNIVGGRINLLIEITKLLIKDQNLENIQRQFVYKAGREFGDLVLPIDKEEVSEKEKKVWRQIIKIYDSPNKEILYIDFTKSLGTLTDEVLQRNIFAYHPSRNTVSFQSRPVEMFVESEIGTPGSAQRQKVYQLIK